MFLKIALVVVAAVFCASAITYLAALTRLLWLLYSKATGSTKKYNMLHAKLGMGWIERRIIEPVTRFFAKFTTRESDPLASLSRDLEAKKHTPPTTTNPTHYPVPSFSTPATATAPTPEPYAPIFEPELEPAPVAADAAEPAKTSASESDEDVNPELLLNEEMLREMTIPIPTLREAQASMKFETEEVHPHLLDVIEGRKKVAIALYRAGYGRKMVRQKMAEINAGTGFGQQISLGHQTKEIQAIPAARPKAVHAA